MSVCEGDHTTTAHPAVMASLAAEQRARAEEKRPATIGDVRRMIAAALADHDSDQARQQR